MATAADLVADLKDRDAESRKQEPANFGVVVLLKADPVLARLVAAWPNVPLSELPDPHAVCPPGTPLHARLRWLWSLLTPDPLPAWIEVAGLPDATYVRRACYAAIDNRMVHPDGELSRWASAFVLDLVKQSLSGGR